jgi:hypothetical protein
VLGLVAFRLGVVGATLPPVAPPMEGPPAPVPAPAASLVPLLCAHAPVATLSVKAAPSASAPILFFMISSCTREQLAKGKRRSSEHVPLWIERKIGLKAARVCRTPPGLQPSQYLSSQRSLDALFGAERAVLEDRDFERHVALLHGQADLIVHGQIIGVVTQFPHWGDLHAV